jgi:hypothetical protein
VIGFPRVSPDGLYEPVRNRGTIVIGWNPLEYRLFSFISLEWAGHPLRSLQLMMSHMEGTTTKTGLQVKAFLNGRQGEGK